MQKIKLWKIVGNLYDRLREIYRESVNGTVIEKYLSFIKLWKILGNFWFSEQIFD